MGYASYTLEYRVREMQVGGFCLDLDSELSSGKHGKPLYHACLVHFRFLNGSERKGRGYLILAGTIRISICPCRVIPMHRCLPARWVLS